MPKRTAICCYIVGYMFVINIFVLQYLILKSDLCWITLSVYDSHFWLKITILIRISLMTLQSFGNHLTQRWTTCICNYSCFQVILIHIMFFEDTFRLFSAEAEFNIFYYAVANFETRKQIYHRYVSFHSTKSQIFP